MSALMVPNLYAAHDNFSFRELMQGELEAVGFTLHDLGPVMAGSLNGGICLFSVSDTSFQSFEAWRILKNKLLTRALLKQLNISYATGKWFARDQINEARAFVTLCSPAVIKPARGSRGRGVSVNVTVDSFDEAWRSAWEELISSKVLVERFFVGDEARYLVIDGRCRAVLRRLPPAVRGDGVSSISQLIQAKNRVRADNPHLRDKLFQLDQHRLALLQSKGWKLDDVVPAGEQIVLDPKGNLSTGADSEDISEAVHSTYAKIAERISGAIQGAHVIGVDILSRDHTRPAQADDYIIIEANTGPGLLGHYYPMYGQRRNVFKLVAESCAQRMGERIRAWSAADRPAPSSQSLQPAT